MKLITRRGVYRLLVFAVVLIVAGLIVWQMMFDMPGKSFAGPLPTLNPRQQVISDQLRADVVMLAATIGERNTSMSKNLDVAAAYVESRFAELGYTPQSHHYEAGRTPCRNIVVEIKGTTQPNRIVVIGAHYDSVAGAPGADDNASAVAVLLALAKSFSQAKPGLTLRFVAFVNEEPPWFQTPRMGSLVYAKACRERDENIVAMVALDGVGYYSDEPESQEYPSPLDLIYPSTGNFISFVSRNDERALVRRCIGAFREVAKLPSEGGVAPESVPGVAWSDHWSFWQCDYPALMVTDTLPFRNPHYHEPSDTPETLDYHRMTLLVDGLNAVLADLSECNNP